MQFVPREDKVTLRKLLIKDIFYVIIVIWKTMIPDLKTIHKLLLDAWKSNVACAGINLADEQLQYS